MRRLDPLPHDRQITIDLEGQPLSALEGEPAACALLAADEVVLSRSIKYHRPRGAFCLVGECSSCLMRVDGVPNVFTCRTPARPGMRLERQNAYPSAKLDVFSAIDWMFPRGLDHHEMFAGVPVAEAVMAKVARHLAGLGTLPDQVAPRRAQAEALDVPALIVGGGAAGLSAARALEAAGASFLLLERESFLGGLRTDAERGCPPSRWACLQTQALGLYDEQDGRFVLAAQAGAGGPRLLRITARRILLAMGGHAALLPFSGNDLPGVMSGRAAAKLLHRHRLLPGERCVVVGQGDEADALCAALTAAGAQVVARPRAEQLQRAHGRGAVKAVTIAVEGGKRRIDCDALLLATPVSAAFELARQGGAAVRFGERDVFEVEADPDGRTAHPALFVAGELRGPMSRKEAEASGARAALAIARELR